ncbi:MAG: hypothetical protein AAF685_17660 [Cyanobacteria bacterium P01_C01_bin.89]
MKPKKNKSILRRLSRLGKGGAAAVVGAFQQIPFGLGTVVSIGIHGLAMPSVISWVQTEPPRMPDSVDVVTLDEAELTQLPESMRNEALTSAPEESDGGSGWDWFTSRGQAVSPTDPDQLPPAANSERSVSRRSGSSKSSGRSRGGWRFGSSDAGESQDEFLSRWRRQLNRAQRRLDIEGGRSPSNDDDSDKGSGESGTQDDGTASGSDENGGDEGDETGEGNETGNGGDTGDTERGNTEGGNTEGRESDVTTEMPPALREAIAQLMEGDAFSHDGISSTDRKGALPFTLAEIAQNELRDWVAKVDVVKAEEEESDNEGFKSEDAERSSHFLQHSENEGWTLPMPSALRCTLAVDPDPAYIAILGGSDGKFVPGESPKIVISSGYKALDAKALEWAYNNLRDTKLTERTTHLIHLIPVSFPPCPTAE